MTSTIKLLFSLLITLSFFPVNGAVLAPTIDDNGTVKIQWTNTADVSRCSNLNSYKISVRRNGQLISTLYQRWSYIKYKYINNITVPATYHFGVFYRQCTSPSSSSWLYAGQARVDIEEIDPNTKVIFIHTDLLGSPVAETLE
ncbi:MULTISPECIES: hypothetical protein [Aliiglaciecola]|uniref:hypothetical protein n=1 Tax=Aliiglaciecola TaxID=1406885 RepID=UPI001C086AE0|nr:MULTISPECIES: hypothetical protein [Aliiglaciecola]MBU2878716.1 hypothetical protein [Aliiglaciecola lipolytica]MDO6711387.1 hypothetical protein [Aliiglaciecola sp. 2_MG-2023]MDO6752164.1 hypothetical protein [Aliiglaciecola sp. 1_MG-2023]